MEFEDYTQVDKEIGSANVHGIVTSLSPIKKSKKGNMYYHGQMCDGKQSMQFVGFASNHQKILQEFLNNKEYVKFATAKLRNQIEIQTN